MNSAPHLKGVGRAVVGWSGVELKEELRCRY